MSFVALYEQHLVDRRMFLERLEAGYEGWIAELSSRPVVDQKATIHCRVDGPQQVSRFDDKDSEQVSRVVGDEIQSRTEGDG